MPDFLTGSPGRMQQYSTLNPQQQGLQNQSITQALSLLQNPQNKFDFAPIVQKARSQFQTQTVPSIAERFTALPGQGGQRSSSFANALGSAGSGLEESLAALQSQYGLQQQGMEQDLLRSLLGFGLQPSNENIYTPRKPGAFESASGGFGQGLGSLLGILPLLLGGGGGGLGLILKLLSGGR